jgi:hypothetical protein
MGLYSGSCLFVQVRGRHSLNHGGRSHDFGHLASRHLHQGQPFKSTCESFLFTSTDGFIRYLVRL